MPYRAKLILDANKLLSVGDVAGSARLLEVVDGQDSVLATVRAAGLFEQEALGAAALESFLSSIPAALDAAILAALRSALDRGLPTQLSWEPGYDFKLKMWESSDGSTGLLNIHLVSPHPDESDLKAAASGA